MILVGMVFFEKRHFFPPGACSLRSGEYDLQAGDHLNLYLLRGGSLRGSHSHLEAAQYNQSGLLATELGWG